jgi:hypothetical protein
MWNTSVADVTPAIDDGDQSDLILNILSSPCYQITFTVYVLSLE